MKWLLYLCTLLLLLLLLLYLCTLFSHGLFVFISLSITIYFVIMKYCLKGWDISGFFLVSGLFIKNTKIIFLHFGKCIKQGYVYVPKNSQNRESLILKFILKKEIYKINIYLYQTFFLAAHLISVFFY